MSAQRLSPLDASFLAVETPDSPMHVGWVATFEGPSPGFEGLFDHIAGRLEAAPRYRQKLAEVPFGVHDQVWVDDASFDVGEHLLHAEGDDLDELVDGILSSPLPRDRPLWQIWITDELPGGRLALIGKMHHCMVDGTAIAELGKALFDASPEAADLRSDGDEWTPAPTPSARSAVHAGGRGPRGRRLFVGPRTAPARGLACAFACSGERGRAHADADGPPAGAELFLQPRGQR